MIHKALYDYFQRGYLKDKGFPLKHTDQDIQLLLKEAYMGLFNEHSHDIFSASQVGLPLIELFYRKFHTSKWFTPNYEEYLTPMELSRMNLGRVFEAELEFVHFPQIEGLEVVSKQPEVYCVPTLEGLEFHDEDPRPAVECITGHPDFIVKYQDKYYCLEVKTTSGSNAKQYVPTYMRRGEYPEVSDHQMSDKYGYRTQLCIYDEWGYSQYGEEWGGSCWIIVNRDNWEVYIRPFGRLDEYVDEELTLPITQRLYGVYQRWTTITSWEEALRTTPLPPPRPEYYQRKPTGNYLLPENMVFARCRELVYETEWGTNGYGKDTLYVTGVKEWN